MEITRRSEATGIEHTMDLDILPWEYARWQRGELGYVQDAFPQLNAEEREFLISGTTPEEWDDLFGDIEEDEDADYTDYPELSADDLLGY